MIPAGFHVPRRTQDLRSLHPRFRLRGSHPLRPAFPCRSPVARFALCGSYNPTICGLGSSVFARRYSRNRSYFLFLQVLRCFSSLRSPRRGYVFTTGCPCHARTGSPIRISAVLCVPAAPRCVSPLAASFFACVCLGIRRKPLLP